MSNLHQRKTCQCQAKRKKAKLLKQVLRDWQQTRGRPLVKSRFRGQDIVKVFSVEGGHEDEFLV